MHSGFEQIDPELFVREGEDFLPDPLKDDLAIIIYGDNGLFIITGCAHRGIINTIHHAQKIMKTQKINTVIGGTHLFHASEEQLKLSIAELKKMGIHKLGVSHCTGFNAEALLWKEFGKSFFLNNAGTKLEL